MTEVKKTAKPRAKKAKAPAPQNIVAAFKGFDPGYRCRGFQYEIGKSYQTERAELCETGFHACENPIDVFRYYAPGASVFAAVELHGDIERGDDKACASGITIKAALTLPGIIQAAIDFTFSRTKPAEGAQNRENGLAASNSGTSGAASNSGDYGAASNSGYRGAASNSGTSGAASNSGDYGAASNSGTSGAASNSGDYGAASNSGTSGAASNSGDYGAASNSGYRGAASNSGDYGAASNSGTSGAASNSGKDGVAAAFGFGSRAMSSDGGIIIVAWWDEKNQRKRVTTGYPSENGVKADVWYTTDDKGNLVEVT